MHKLYSGLDNKENACVVFLDISKAFDRVWHEGLLFKLKTIRYFSSVIKMAGKLSGRQKTKGYIRGWLF